MRRVLRGANLVDGTGGPARAADVAVVDDRITEVGEVEADAGDEVVDLGGLTLAPGFIDIHTHYDAQVLWDPDLTPSSWHGVTSVVMGNCGFSIAPTRPEHRETIARTLENVEGMSAEALAAGIPWTFETYPEYLDVLRRQPKRLNVGSMIGHTALRLYVLGDEAVDRPATDDEVAEMKSLVAEALRAGALGFATSKSPNHMGAAGKPVPSRLAEPDEVFRIAEALRDEGTGIVQVTPGPGLFLEQFAAMSKDLGRPVTWTALLTRPGRHGQALEAVNKTAELGGEVWPQVAALPLGQIFNLADPFPLAPIPSFADVLAVRGPARADVYADPAWREKARPEVDDRWKWLYQTSTIYGSEKHPELIGLTLQQAAEKLGSTPFDTLLDLSLEEELRTRFQAVFANDDEDELGQLLNDKRTVLGLSDAGAHASQICDARFSTYLLKHWVREKKELSLEDAVWRLTGHAADVFRLGGRGRVQAGGFADLVAFDLDAVDDGELERVYDFPAGADRLIAHSGGIEHVWVNGQPIRRDGADVEGARPGVLLAGGAR